MARKGQKPTVGSAMPAWAVEENAIRLNRERKLRKLTLAQCETAEQIFAEMERSRQERDQDSEPDDYDNRHSGPVKLASPFDGLKL